jgi:hypothetical protein
VAATDEPLEQVLVLQVAAGHDPIVDQALLRRDEVRLGHDDRDRHDDPLLARTAGGGVALARAPDRPQRRVALLRGARLVALRDRLADVRGVGEDAVQRGRRPQP